MLSEVLGGIIKYGTANVLQEPTDSMGISDRDHMIIHIKGSDNAFYK